MEVLRPGLPPVDLDTWFCRNFEPGIMHFLVDDPKPGVLMAHAAGVVESLRRRPGDWVRFMMRFELGLEAPQPGRAWKSALTIAAAYVVGGLIPLSAYLLMSDTHRALRLSIAVTLVALAAFGGAKGHLTGVPTLRSALQTTLVGGLAAAAAFVIARWVA